MRRRWTSSDVPATRGKHRRWFQPDSIADGHTVGGAFWQQMHQIAVDADHLGRDGAIADDNAGTVAQPGAGGQAARLHEPAGGAGDAAQGVGQADAADGGGHAVKQRVSGRHRILRSWGRAETKS